jgi:biopolymer transport protein ExbB
MTKRARALCGAFVALVIVSQGETAYAQQTGGGVGAGQGPAAFQAQPATIPAAPPAASSPPPMSAGPLTTPSPAAPASTELPAAADDSARPAPGIGHLRELSPWSMFVSADILVKAVMISLIFASLVTWTIFLAKTIQLARARTELNGALARIANSKSLSEAQLALGSTTDVLSELLAAATAEIKLSADRGGEGGIKERAASRFSEIVRMEARTVRYGMSLIATIGATAPFVGLFGTVWGIMNSFIGISKAQTTNLAVVAPGIAEALLATAIGLAAAIPAVIIYNHFSRATKGYLEIVGRGSGAIGRLLSRDLDRFQGRLISRAAE